MVKNLHGSASFSNIEEVVNSPYYTPQDFGLFPAGNINDKASSSYISLLNYTGNRHAMTIASNRSGKGAGVITPFLLEYFGGIFCLDPKGENAIITAEHRALRVNTNIAIIDPWQTTYEHIETKELFIGYNPLAFLDPANPDFFDDVFVLADAIIIPSKQDPFWTSEAKAVLTALIAYVMTEDGETHSLARVRDLVSLDGEKFIKLTRRMSKSANDIVSRSANRILQKNEKELAYIMSTIQENTHFLESQAIRESLSVSKEESFDFSALTYQGQMLSPTNRGACTIYIVIPPEKIGPFKSWLRLLITSAITRLLRSKRSHARTVFLLDEFAQLEQLSIIEKGYGIFAGYNILLWIIAQDLNQLKKVYPESWETFIANSGLIQLFGVNDYFTAEYFSKKIGKTTINFEKKSTSSATNSSYTTGKENTSTTGRTHTESTSQEFVARDLVTPDEIMNINSHSKSTSGILFLDGLKPIKCFWPFYYYNMRYYFIWEENEIFRAFKKHPNYGEIEASQVNIFDYATHGNWTEITGQPIQGKSPPTNNNKTIKPSTIFDIFFCTVIILLISLFIILSLN